MLIKKLNPRVIDGHNCTILFISRVKSWSTIMINPYGFITTIVRDQSAFTTAFRS